MYSVRPSPVMIFKRPVGAGVTWRPSERQINGICPGSKNVPKWCGYCKHCVPEENLPWQGWFVTFPSQPVALTQGWEWGTTPCWYESTSGLLNIPNNYPTTGATPFFIYRFFWNGRDAPRPCWGALGGGERTKRQTGFAQLQCVSMRLE